MTIPIPLPGVGDVLATIPAARAWWKERNRAKFLEAWQRVKLHELYDIIVRYYQEVGVPLFSFPSVSGARTVIPLYVAHGWPDLTDNTLKLTLRNRHELFEPTNDHLEFWERFREFKCLDTGRDWPLHDNDVFRLKKNRRRQGIASLTL